MRRASSTVFAVPIRTSPAWPSRASCGIGGQPEGDAERRGATLDDGLDLGIQRARGNAGHFRGRQPQLRVDRPEQLQHRPWIDRRAVRNVGEDVDAEGTVRPGPHLAAPLEDLLRRGIRTAQEPEASRARDLCGQRRRRWPARHRRADQRVLGPQQGTQPRRCTHRDLPRRERGKGKPRGRPASTFSGASCYSFPAGCSPRPCPFASRPRRIARSSRRSSRARCTD